MPRRRGPNFDLRSDPRADPRVIAALAPFGLDRAAPPPQVGRTSPREAQLSYLAERESSMEAVFAALVADLPPIDGVGHSTETVTGVDGNDIALSRALIHPPDRSLSSEEVGPRLG